MLDFEHVDGAAPSFVEEIEEFHDLLLQQEVSRAEFRAGTVLTTKFDLANNSRWWIEERFPILEDKVFHPAESNLLADLQQAVSPWRE